jgi:hypothetical protein
VNLTIEIFSRAPVISSHQISFLTRIKYTIHRGLYYVLLFIFIIISIAVILLSFRMLRV